MNHGADSSTPAPGDRKTNQDGPALFWAAFRQRPFQVGFGLIVEYLMFAAGVFLALSLFVLRVPLRLLDQALGLQLRERFIDFIARLSPG
jgi:hypothetical protein